MTDSRSFSHISLQLTSHPHRDKLAQMVWHVARQAAASRSRPFAPFLASISVTRSQAETPLGNIWTLLERGPNDAQEGRLLSILLAHGIALTPPVGVDEEDRLVTDLLWLAGHTRVDAFPALEIVGSERTGGLWGALGDLLRRIDQGREPTFDRADALMAASLLRGCVRDDVRSAVRALREEITDPALRELLQDEHPGVETLPSLHGSLEPAPTHLGVTILLAVTGILAIWRFSRLFATFALARKTSTEVEIQFRTIRVKSRTELLGKVLREYEWVLPVPHLTRATREVLYPRLTVYMGLFALALGSYFGTTYLVDGVRSASPSLLAYGCLFLALGLGFELALTTLIPSGRSHCRLILTGKNGVTLCIGQLDQHMVEKALTYLRR